MKAHLTIWLEAARLRTLPLAVASIFIGNVYAYYSGSFSWSIFVLCLLTALLLQILSNFSNDYGDGMRGSDDARTEESEAFPRRVLAGGLLTPRALRWGMLICALLAVLSGLLLLNQAIHSYQDFCVFILLGMMAIIAAITYTAGKIPYGYHALGDVSVFIFFGLLGVCGSYYLQTQSLNSSVLLPAISSGLLCASVLNVNNMRDRESDRRNGKQTLAGLLGAQRMRYYHTFLILGADLINALFALLVQTWIWLWLLILPWQFKHLRHIYCAQDAASIGRELKPCVFLALSINVLMSLGLLIAHTLHH